MDQDKAQPDPPAWQGYCRGCGYMLRGLVSERCPECGREFDQADPKTFRKTPRPAWRWWAVRVFAVLVLLALLPAGGVGWLYWEWRQEQPAVELANRLSGSVRTKLVGPQWLQDRMPAKLRWLLVRVEDISIASRQEGGLTDSDLACLAKLRNVTGVSIASPDITDAGLAHLGRLTQLKTLSIVSFKGTGVTDAGLEHLKELKNLDRLVMRSTGVRGSGLRHMDGTNIVLLNLQRTSFEPQYLAELQRFPKLHALALGGTPMDDAALRHVADLEKITRLWLDSTKITDDGLRILAEMEGLEILILADNPQLSDEAVRELKKALPNAMIP